MCAHADIVRWLYDVDIPVASQAERQRAARTGLGELLVRVTGLAELPPNPEIRAALREAENYYGRFEFWTERIARERTVADDDAASEAGADAAETMFLRIHYEPATVLGLLRRAGLPVWSVDRPSVLAWIAIETDGARQIVSSGGTADLAAALQQQARRRGIELSAPSMDLTDLGVAPGVVWGRFWNPVEAASKRYRRDVIVLGRVAERADGSWVADWELRSTDDAKLLGRSEPGTVRAETATEAVVASVDFVADTLAERFAVGGRLDAIAVTIRGASTIAAYASVLDYLQSREYIERLDVKTVARDALTLKLHSRSSTAQLEELLSMGGSLSVVRGTGALGQPLEFEWRGDG